MGMNELAQHILAVGKENNIPVTNLALQKVMYYTLKAGYDQELLKENDVENLYDKPFLVWKYGPVVKDIYEEYSLFGADNITGEFKYENTLADLDELIIKLLKMNVFTLVSSTHLENFWKDNEQHICGFRSDIPYKIIDVIGE